MEEIMRDFITINDYLDLYRLLEKFPNVVELNEKNNTVKIIPFYKEYSLIKYSSIQNFIVDLETNYKIENLCL
jgi:hypothetical protein